ncbi:cytochrome [Moniliophthora roreri]|uniref:Cytochrome P450 n=1 Tax=Moniliophthora roreri TaxID=221103 RepID=A0A0W0G9F0_MONRR|nr:cytochrome [Moniliophthora roreri]
MGSPGVYALVVLVLVHFFLRRFFRRDHLAHFPGPVLARWTWLYRAYYDIIIGGGWTSHLKTLHEAYGPVVRVGLNELHFTEPVAYTDIYNSPYKLPKDPDFYQKTFNLGLPLNIFSTTDPKDHSAMKSLFSSYFSRRNILKLESSIQEHIDTLVLQLLKNHKASPVSMHYAFRSVGLDIITFYTLRTNPDATSFPDFHHPAFLGMDNAMESTWILRHFPFLKQIAIRFPAWLLIRISPGLKPNLEMNAEVERLVGKAILDSQQDSEEDESEFSSNVLHTLLRNARVEGRLKRADRLTRGWLIAEAAGLRIAGSDTIANTCTIGARCLVRDDRTAVIKESLRLTSGIVTPMNRVVPDSGAIIAGHPIPPGTVVSIGNTFVHMNPDIFPDPERFYPERWLEDKDHSLDRYLVSFGKGLRACLGINLAWCELYMILGNVFRKLDFQSKSDLWSEIKFMDYFVPMYEHNVLDVTVSERE